MKLNSKLKLNRSLGLTKSKLQNYRSQFGISGFLYGFNLLARNVVVGLTCLSSHPPLTSESLYKKRNDYCLAKRREKEDQLFERRRFVSVPLSMDTALGAGGVSDGGFSPMNDDILHNIFGRLPAQSFAAAAYVCKTWNSVCNRILCRPKFSSAVSLNPSLHVRLVSLFLYLVN